MALDGGMDGLVLIRKLLSQAPDLLAPGGLLLMEIEASEGSAALSLAHDAFSEAEIHLHKDLAGRDRLLEVQI
jgi:release factor glutamine methyltransferase